MAEFEQDASLDALLTLAARQGRAAFQDCALMLGLDGPTMLARSAWMITQPNEYWQQISACMHQIEALRSMQAGEGVTKH